MHVIVSIFGRNKLQGFFFVAVVRFFPFPAKNLGDVPCVEVGGAYVSLEKIKIKINYNKCMLNTQFGRDG